MLKIINIIPDTIVDGPRMRTSIYLSGCFHGCKGCHNPSSWKLDNGKDTEFSVLIDKIREYGHKRLTISGGDGLCYQHKELLEFLKVLKKEIPDINIWLYTGYTFEEIIIDEDRKYILNYIDVLVDGKFIEDLKSKDCLYRGSTNQRLIKVSDSLNSGQIILYS